MSLWKNVQESNIFRIELKKKFQAKVRFFYKPKKYMIVAKYILILPTCPYKNNNMEFSPKKNYMYRI